MMISLLNLIITIIFMLLSMAFFTLLEHKILGYTQHRKGPNKVGACGLPQPMTDATKLLSKSKYLPSKANKLTFYMGSMSALLLALVMWSLFPTINEVLWVKFSILMFLAVSSTTVYPTMMMGWSANSKYSLLGGVRSIAQTVSYEISMALILFNLLLLQSTLNMSMLTHTALSLLMVSMPLSLMWIMTVLAETSRAPFDLTEGESELVSGFNTEYSGGLFVLIFIAEYMNIILMAALSSLMLLPLTSHMWNTPLYMWSLTLCGVFITIRSSYPRIRYDLLMMMTWVSLLPTSIMTATLNNFIS